MKSKALTFICLLFGVIGLISVDVAAASKLELWMHGRPAALSPWASPLSPDAALDDWAAKRGFKHVVKKRVGHWQIAGTFQNGAWRGLQVRPTSGGCQGWEFTLGSKSQALPAGALHLRAMLPPGTSTRQEVLQQEGGRWVGHWVSRHGASLEALRQRFDSHLLTQGARLDPAFKPYALPDGAAWLARWETKSGELVVHAVRESGGTVLVMQGGWHE